MSRLKPGDLVCTYYNGPMELVQIAEFLGTDPDEIDVEKYLPVYEKPEDHSGLEYYTYEMVDEYGDPISALVRRTAVNLEVIFEQAVAIVANDWDKAPRRIDEDVVLLVDKE